MARTHNLGFPRIGAQRELKVAEEKYWKGVLTHDELEQLAARLRRQSWQRQAGLNLVPVGDFSLYDQILDASFLLGNVPERAGAVNSQPLDAYFRIARGRAAGDLGPGVAAGEMTKWFDTQIGPGVYDIHSPNVPTERQIFELMNEAAKRIPAARLWVNPECGLKTRNWEEVLPALKNMVAAAHRLRATHTL